MTHAEATPAADVLLRPAEMGDADRLFDWANRADSLAASLETAAPIDWDTHVAWVAERLADPATRVWIVEAGGLPVGHLRLQNKGEGPEVAIYVDTAARGCGVAAAALEGALAAERGTGPNQAVLARVREDNAGSQRFFERCGFELLERRPDHRVYRRTP